MEPRIQFATTSDEVSIAFWTLGKGMPFVSVPQLPWSHIQLEWQNSALRRFYEALAQKRKLIRYDSRGSGLSERNVLDYSIDAHVLDLEAVVDRLALERFALCGVILSGPVAITYAARHPERVSHLILWCTFSRYSDLLQMSEAAASRALRRAMDWGLFTETLAHMVAGWSEGEEARRFAALFRECITPEEVQAAYDAIAEYDVAGLLPQVRSPTLVLHRRQISWLPLDIARTLASSIPDARLAPLEGESAVPFLGDKEEVLAAVDEFLAEEEEVAAKAEPPAIDAILFTDVEGSTTLTQRLGDASAQELVRTHNRIVREALKGCGGSEIKHTGDGIMASFPSASGALDCAVAIQTAFSEHNQEHPDATIRVRIGLNAGEPVAEEHDLFGTAVQLAARICSHAEPGQILISDVVRQLVAGKGFLFSDRGETVLRGFEDPVRLYEVRWVA